MPPHSVPTSHVNLCHLFLAQFKSPLTNLGSRLDTLCVQVTLHVVLLVLLHVVGYELGQGRVPGQAKELGYDK